MRPWGAFLTGFTVSAAYWPGMLSAVFVPRWAAIAVLIPLLWRVDLKAISPRVACILFVAVACSALSLVQSPSLLTGLHEFFFVLILSVAFLAAAGVDRLDDVMAGLGAGLSLSSLLIIGQLYGWSPVVQSAPPAGLFYNSEILAELAALVLVWGIVRRNWWIVAATLLPVVACDSRIAVFTVLIALAYAYMPRRMIWWGIGALVVLAPAALFLVGMDKAGSALHRFVLWGATVMAIEPIGNGLGWFEATHPLMQFAHSDVLQIVAEIGVSAIILLFLPWWILREKLGHVAERAVFVGVCFQMLVSFPLQFPATGFVAAMVAGHLLGHGSLVRVGQHHRRTDDGGSIPQSQPHGKMGLGFIGRGSSAVSVRSVFARRAGLRAPAHSAAVGG